MASAEPTFLSQCTRGSDMHLPNTPQVKELEKFACRGDFQHILQNMIADVFVAQPTDPLDFMLQEVLGSEQRRVSADMPAEPRRASRDVQEGRRASRDMQEPRRAS
ncbi:hypothetical protein WJX72_002533 [[Myrmecia] bisecta]|uniref:Uncharacterized protein n=1 Tax=[Myrmecia] bisecta TaxID=41462 RepID=A0AAW1QPF2_9CHLO